MELFDATDEALDQIATLVTTAAVGSLNRAIGFGQDHGLRTVFLDEAQQRIRVVGSNGGDTLGRDVLATGGVASGPQPVRW